MSRLPKVGGDEGNWGEILNDFLSQSHTNTGSLKDNTVGTNQLQNSSVGTPQFKDNSVTNDKLASTGEANGIATLDSDGKLPESQVPERLGEEELKGVVRRAATPRFGWISPRSLTAPMAAVSPIVTWETASPYIDGITLPYDTSLVARPSGVYSVVNWPGEPYLDNTVNFPNVGPNVNQTEFQLTGSECALVVFCTSATNEVRILVDGTIAYSGSAPASMTKYWLKISFPFVATRTVCVQTRNVLHAGVNFSSSAAGITPPASRRITAALYGDSWTANAGATDWRNGLAFILAQALGWNIARMGHGGSGYVTDAVDVSSVPLTDLTRLTQLTALVPDYVIVLGSINDSDKSASAIKTAALAVYSYIAEHSPRTKVIVVGVQPQPAGVGAGHIAANVAIAEAARESPNVVAFLDALTEEWLSSEDSGLMADSAHPNDAGYAKFASAFIDRLVGL